MIVVGTCIASSNSRKEVLYPPVSFVGTWAIDVLAIHLEVFFFFFLVVATFAAILVRSFNETKLRVDDSSELFWNGEYSKVCVYTYFLEI